MNVIQKFLVICSGSSTEILKKTPTDVNKHVGIGGVILFTGILAALSSGYALYTIFDNMYAAVGFGALWGLMIFNLDRYIVTSMKKQGNWFRQFFIALPRIAVAILLGIVISKPLELKIFEKEINKQLNVIVNRNKAELQKSIDARYVDLAKPVDEERKKIYAQIDTLRNQYNLASAELEKEVVGTQTETTTGREGYGPNAKRKAELKEQKFAEMQQYADQMKPRLDELNKEIDKLIAQKEKELTDAKPTEENYNGFAARMQALNELSANNPILGTAAIFIALVFISLETAPVLVKLIAPKGPYDFLLEKHEHSFKIFAKESIEIMDIKSDRRIQKEISQI
ncbi:DUF4407 domain-containing protein [Faecalibacter macacae]|uniref:DUF4407 domain-containing protein n=1 Tax=Faecalibacter macacae TaxID=1859289 RepID=A0A3L9M8G9_9FLAO|nr:DUF4407 domain-containing protein [Faecalibacter macacae]RLZ07564.1 DUF4407 domain-containing protein [Faecalibacter macacae]